MQEGIALRGMRFYISRRKEGCWKGSNTVGHLKPIFHGSFEDLLFTLMQDWFYFWMVVCFNLKLDKVRVCDKIF